MKAASLPAKVAARLMRKMGLALEVKPPGIRKARMMESLTLKPLAAVRLQMWLNQRKIMMWKLMEPAMRLKSQTLRAVSAPENLMVRFQPEWLHWEKRSKEAPQQRRPRQVTSTPLRCPHCPILTTRTQRSRKFSNTRMPGSWTKTSASGMTK